MSYFWVAFICFPCKYFADVEIRRFVVSNKYMKKQVLYIFCFQDYYKLSVHGRILYFFLVPYFFQSLLRFSLENKAITIRTTLVSAALILILWMPYLGISFICKKTFVSASFFVQAAIKLLFKVDCRLMFNQKCI